MHHIDYDYLNLIDKMEFLSKEKEKLQKELDKKNEVLARRNEELRSAREACRKMKESLEKARIYIGESCLGDDKNAALMVNTRIWYQRMAELTNGFKNMSRLAYERQVKIERLQKELQSAKSENEHFRYDKDSLRITVDVKDGKHFEVNALIVPPDFNDTKS